MKPEIGSKWRCVGALNQCCVGDIVEVGAVNDTFAFVENGRAYRLARFGNGGQFIPLSPAPAEPAKAAGWKAGDRFTVSGTVMADHGGGVSVSIDGEDGLRSFMGIERAALRPEVAPPAAAPVGDWVSGKEHAVVKGELQSLQAIMANRGGPGQCAADLRAEVARMRAQRDAAGQLLGKDQMHAAMRIGDLQAIGDLASSRLTARELELGDKEREIARLRSALRDATDRARKVGRL